LSPFFLFIVALIRSRAVAVIMPNQQGLDPDWRAYRVSVRDVEELTGYTFFSELPADAARALKSARPEERGKSPKPSGEGPGKGKVKKGGKLPGELAAFEEGCVIGNRRTKKYHVLGGRGYDRAKTSKNAVFFKTAEDAKKAGYTQAAR
jgi:hypothetical protein